MFKNQLISVFLNAGKVKLDYLSSHNLQKNNNKKPQKTKKKLSKCLVLYFLKIEYRTLKRKEIV